MLNPLSANPTKWSNTLKQFLGYLSVFDHFVGLALKGLIIEDARSIFFVGFSFKKSLQVYYTRIFFSTFFYYFLKYIFGQNIWKRFQFSGFSIISFRHK